MPPFQLHALVKIYSFAVEIATPYFSVMYAIYPKWFFRLLVDNPAILKRNPYVLSTLLVVGNVISNIGRGLSALLSGRWKTIYHRYFSGHKATRQRYTSTKERIYQENNDSGSGAPMHALKNKTPGQTVETM